VPGKWRAACEVREIRLQSIAFDGQITTYCRDDAALDSSIKESWPRSAPVVSIQTTQHQISTSCSGRRQCRRSPGSASVGVFDRRRRAHSAADQMSVRSLRSRARTPSTVNSTKGWARFHRVRYQEEAPASTFAPRRSPLQSRPREAPGRHRLRGLGAVRARRYSGEGSERPPCFCANSVLMRRASASWSSRMMMRHAASSGVPAATSSWARAAMRSW